MKAGQKVARTGWNGKGMWLILIPAGFSGITVDGKIESFKALPYIAMKTVQGDLVPWLASQTDMLAEDWQILN